MNHPNPGRRPAMPEDMPRQGNTIPAQGEIPQKAPRLPHEHDESADSQSAPTPSTQRPGQQDADDPIRKFPQP